MMTKAPVWLGKFDPDAGYVVLKPRRILGRAYAKGEKLDKRGIATRSLRLMFEQRLIGPDPQGDAGGPDAPFDPVQAAIAANNRIYRTIYNSELVRLLEWEPPFDPDPYGDRGGLGADVAKGDHVHVRKIDGAFWIVAGNAPNYERLDGPYRTQGKAKRVLKEASRACNRTQDLSQTPPPRQRSRKSPTKKGGGGRNSAPSSRPTGQTLPPSS